MKLIKGYIWLALACFGWACSGSLVNLDPTQAQLTTHREELASGARDDAKPITIATAGRFKTALYRLSADPTNAALVPLYLDAGMTVSRFRCDDYFRALTVRAAQLEFGRGEANLAGGAGAAILGLTNAAAPIISGLGVGMALLNSSFSNYTTNFLPFPDIGTLEKLVMKAQATLEEEFRANPPATYPAAESALLAFDQVCSYGGLKMLMNEAVLKAQPTVSAPPPMFGAARASQVGHRTTPVLEIR